MVIPETRRLSCITTELLKVVNPTKVETPVTSKLASTSKSLVEVTPNVVIPVT